MVIGSDNRYLAEDEGHLEITPQLLDELIAITSAGVIGGDGDEYNSRQVFRNYVIS